MSPDERLGGDAGAEGSAALSAAFSAAFSLSANRRDSALSAVLAAALLSAALLSETPTRIPSASVLWRAVDGRATGRFGEAARGVAARGARSTRASPATTRAPRRLVSGRSTVRSAVARLERAPAAARARSARALATESVAAVRWYVSARAAALADATRGRDATARDAEDAEDAFEASEASKAFGGGFGGGFEGGFEAAFETSTWWTRISGFSSAFEACSTAAALLARDPDPSSSSPYARRYASAMAVSCD